MSWAPSSSNSGAWGDSSTTDVLVAAAAAGMIHFQQLKSGTSITKRCFSQHWSLQLLLRSDVLGLPAPAQM
ncbi:hypothetical protein PVAP13_8KG097103 [Panicum virgatum]|uniref:Uncharacterized protein n=1 Tax=Panicum virgatum TaxID=38727 RepID=A0A8T0PLK3_PANVG|nr:hypothetical protein PVAP13_8KG097103 [Panicum virgatum]